MATDAVVDSSVIVALVTPEEQSDWAEKTIEKYQYLHTLDLSFYEVANAIEHKLSDRFNTNDVSRTFNDAERIMSLYAVHGFGEVVKDSLIKAVTLKIAVYDAAYLSLADKLKMPFLTLDLKFVKKLEGTKYSGLIESPNKRTNQ